MDKAPASGAGDCGFESRHRHFSKRIAMEIVPSSRTNSLKTKWDIVHIVKAKINFQRQQL
ncbi:hypothetical protein T10_11414 [Trichinella papuae]|uniref:Uncharacterized protein n=1 Tax=Trichinella papuae TaxID=268474 RepID=A0A0V1MB54_9BILA|nr:hypothetical protein T10_11414 [Trichinella papuae]